MKTKEKNFDAVEFVRKVRTKISKETEGMNFEQLKIYFAHRRLILANKYKA